MGLFCLLREMGIANIFHQIVFQTSERCYDAKQLTAQSNKAINQL
jgi:hypothetical protein